AVLLADIDEQALRLAPAGIETAEIGFSLRTWLERSLAGADAVVCAAPASTAPEIAAVARQCGCHYLDTIEDTRTALQVAEIAAGATGVFVPGCGLAPGLVGALTREAAADAGPSTELTVYIGVLPCEPKGRLGYADFWGIDGLLSEYTGECLAIRDGRAVSLAPLAEHETCHIAGWDLEAFTTAGTLDGLVPDLAGRIGALTFKTLRTRGHLDYIRFLIEDMGLGSRLYQLKNLLLNALPQGECDRVFIQIARRDGPDAPARTWTWTLAASGAAGGHLAISLVTAAHLASVLDGIFSGAGGGSGLVRADGFGLDALARSPFFPPLPPGVSLAG
ncbi:MAG: hypothetical protein WAT70_10215, partial [Rhizobiaceae bacterium]